MPDESKFRYTKEHPYIGKGLNREVKEGVEYVGYKADVAEFNDLYINKAYRENGVNKMGLGIDEIVESTINLSRKNYADYFPENPYPKDVKMVGNTIKSKKMPEYIAKFLSVGIRLLLRGNGQEFLDEYYSYIDKLYNYQIPLRDIATKGKIKRSVQEYLADMKTLTKAGRPKSRQAWYELAIQNNMEVLNGETIYYVNIGTSKSHNDLKKITSYIEKDMFGEKKDVTKEIEKEYKSYQKSHKNSKSKEELLTKDEWIKKERPKVNAEFRIELKCKIVPQWVIDADEDKMCYDVRDKEGHILEYNRAKYIDMFNKRITPLLVCFDREIRGDILVTDPKDRKYFTSEQCELVSGQPNKPGDQDTYEQLMTMEDKEIRFWKRNNLVPPFLEECGMGKWEDILADYEMRMDKEKELGIDKEKDTLSKAISKLTKQEAEDIIEEYIIPTSLSSISTFDADNGLFMSKIYPEIIIGYTNDILDRLQQIKDLEDSTFEVDSETEVNNEDT